MRPEQKVKEQTRRQVDEIRIKNMLAEWSQGNRNGVIDTPQPRRASLNVFRAVFQNLLAVHHVAMFHNNQHQPDLLIDSQVFILSL